MSKTFLVKISVDDTTLYSDLENAIDNIIVVQDVDLIEEYDD